MDNNRFDPMRFSPDALPSLEQLQREQSYTARSDAFSPEYERREAQPQPYAPQPGYGPGYPYAPQPQPYAPQPVYAPGYPGGYQQPDPMQGYDAPMQHAAYMPPRYPYNNMDPRAFGQIPSYEELAHTQRTQPSYYLPDDPDYRPQHMKEPPRYADEPPRAAYYDQPYARPAQPAAPQPETARPQPEQADSFDTLPSLIQLRQALEEERQAEAQMRAMEAQRRAMEAQQKERDAMAQRPIPPQPPTAKSVPQRDMPPVGGQAPQRFVIEDLALDEDDESHTKKKTSSMEEKEKTQFSSLLKRFRPKNS